MINREGASWQLNAAGVVGGGTMGVGIAYVLAAAGAQITVVEPDPDRRKAVSRSISDRVRKLENENRLETGLGQKINESISTVSNVFELDTCLDVIIEAVPENLDLKVAVLTQAQQRAPHLLGTNTSSISITRLGETLGNADKLVGLHFFNPVWSMPLLEIIFGDKTSTDSMRAAVALGARIGKDVIQVRDIPGFATSRLGVAIGLEAIRMLEDGVASATDIDQAMVLGYRHPMGPLRLTDLVGLDVRLGIAERLTADLGPRFTPPDLLRQMVAEGRLGQKAGAGFFEWDQP